MFELLPEVESHILDMLNSKELGYIVKDVRKKFNYDENKALWCSMRIMGENDLYFWNKNIMEYRDMQPLPHRDMCRFMEFEYEGGDVGSVMKLMQLVPRDCFKTSLNSGRKTRRLVTHPNDTSLIFASSDSQAEKKGLEIQGRMQHSKTFRWLYGDITDSSPDLYEGGKKKRLKWTNAEFDTTLRTEFIGAGYHNVMALTIGSGRAGIHVNEIDGDDIHDEENSQTKEGCETVKQRWVSKRPLLKPGGKFFLNGTRYHMMDIYQSYIDNGIEWHPDMKPDDVKGHKGYVYYWKGSTTRLKKGTVFFPARYPENVLLEIKQEYSDIGKLDFYYLQYENAIEFGEDAEFKKEWLEKAWTSPEENWENNYLFDILMDAAYTEKQSSDYTALILIGSKDGSPVKYVVDWDIYKTNNPTIILDWITQAYERHALRFRNIYMQKAAAEEIYKKVMEKSERHRMLSGRIKDVSVARQNKEARINTLKVPFQTHNIKIHLHLKKTAAGLEFQEEYRLQTKAAHDDMMDALAMQNQLPPSKKKRKKKKRLFWNDRIKRSRR